MNTESANVTRLGSPCSACGALLVLVEGADNVVECPDCPAESADGATVADALEGFYSHNPPPAVVAVTAALDIVPRHPWVIECNGFPFNTLTEAETYSATHGDGAAIFCRLGSSQKAANDHH